METKQHTQRLGDQEVFEGKTYSLRRSVPNSDQYYTTVGALTDTLLRDGDDIRLLLGHVQKLSKSKRRLRGLLRDPRGSSSDGALLHTLGSALSQYTLNVRSHLLELSPLKRWDRTLAASVEQYHLYMLEIELVNRMHAEEFRRSTNKLAFLPHCLRDLNADCRAAQRDLDYVCKGCTVECNVNHASKLLRRHAVKPYIWMTADLRGLFKQLKKEGNSLAVLGIACIPELVRGMRLCMKYNVPVVGVPLDANRCARWWGEFHWNTVNLEKLEALLAG